MASSTTTIRLPDDLKESINQLAQMHGQTPHAYIVQALAERIELDKRASEFESEALARLSQFKQDGLTIPFDEMTHYLRKRIQGKNTTPPVFKKWVG